jgi:hypothetical protein
MGFEIWLHHVLFLRKIVLFWYKVVFPTRFLPLPVNRLFGPPITVKYRQILTVKTGKNDLIKNHTNQHLIIEIQHFSNAE